MSGESDSCRRLVIVRESTAAPSRDVLTGGETHSYAGRQDQGPCFTEVEYSLNVRHAAYDACEPR